MSPQRLMLLSFILFDGFLWAWAVFGTTPAYLTAELFTAVSVFLWGFFWWIYTLGRDNPRER